MFPSDLPETHQPVIIAARRTPIAKAFQELTHVDPEDLAAPVLKALIDENGLDPLAIDDVILGNATGGGGNIARLSLLTAGLPISVPGVTVDRQCGSGLEAIILACNLIAAGGGQLYLAGGVESVSRAPLRYRRPRHETDAPEYFGRARFSPDSIGDPEMGVAAENVATKYGISRERQDAFALESHRRAVMAQASGAFDAERVPIEVSNSEAFLQDSCPRENTSLEQLSNLPPVFVENGTVTAGNSCPLNDGACVVTVTSRARAKALGAQHALGFSGAASAGVDPNYLGIGPVPATQKLLRNQPDLTLEAASFIEFNEAFASQVLASLDALAIAEDRVNLQGGALALGHPFGASGAVLVTRLFHQFRQQEANLHGDLSFAMMGIGGGMGLSAAFRYETLS